MSLLKILRPLNLARQLPIYRNLPSRTFRSSAFLLSERKFTKEHEWLTLDVDVATVGISNYAQEHLGEVVYCELPGVGDKLEKDGNAGTIESVKSASDVYCPVGGEVTKVNKELESSPQLLNSDCYGAGWIFQVKVDNLEEVKELMNEEEYEKFIKTLD